jgi:hypothetical protein
VPLQPPSENRKNFKLKKTISAELETGEMVRLFRFREYGWAKKKTGEEEVQQPLAAFSRNQNMSGNFGLASNHLWQQEQYFQLRLM